MSDKPATKAPPKVEPPVELDPRRWSALWVVLAASFMALFDLFVVNVAAPSIQQGLHTTTAAIQLIIAGYSFTYAIGLITGGRLGDILGPRAIFLLGMSIFTISLLVCGIAPNAPVLIAARLGQGAGASLMVPQVLTLIQLLFPAAERPRAFAYFGANAGLGSVAGQVLGGVLLSANPLGLHWRGIFIIQLPIGVAGLIAGRLLLPNAPGKAAAATGGQPPVRRFDPVGATLLGLALAALLIPLTLGRQTGWPAWSFGCLIAVAPLLGAFAVQQRGRVARGAVPLIVPRLFADRSFTLGLLINMAFYAELGSFFLIITWFLQKGLGLSPMTAGLTFASLGFGFVIGSFFLVRRLAASHARSLLSYGVTLVLLAVIAGTVLIGLKGIATTPLETVPILMLVGFGNGLVLPTTLNVVIGGVADKELAGSASGVLVTMQQIGTALGAAGVGAIFFALLGRSPAGGAYKTAMVTTLVVDSALVLVTGVLIAALLLLSRKGGVVRR